MQATAVSWFARALFYFKEFCIRGLKGFILLYKDRKSDSKFKALNVDRLGCSFHRVFE